MIQQLRIYRIEPTLRQEFEDRFKDHAFRIMKTHGFDIEDMWFSEFEEQTQFVYILNWEDQATHTKQWEAFLADQEWIDIKDMTREKYGEMVLDKVRDQVLIPLN